MNKRSEVKIVLTSHGALWNILVFENQKCSLDKQRLPQRLDKRYWIRLVLSNRRFGWLCQSTKHLWLFSSNLRRSTIRKVSTLKMIQLDHTRKIETGSNKSFFCSMSTTKTMVSVKSINLGWFIDGRGYIVPHTRGKVAIKQYGTIKSQDCKNETRRYNFEPGEVLLKGEKILSDIWRRNLQNIETENNRLWGILKHDDIWINSFLKLADNQGAYTTGSDNIQIANFSLEKVMAVKKNLLSEKFKWGKSRCIFIPKGENTNRPLTIPNFEDRLVQEVLRILLSVIYEPCFSKHSHGFRTGRSCHTALRDVRKNFKGCKWILEGDISGFFDKVSHSTLISILKKKIKDDRIISLINKGLKAKILVPKTGEVIDSKRGLTQGGVLSPLLSNIYLNEFDKYMECYIKKFNVEVKRPQNNEYRKIVRKFKSRKVAIQMGLRPTDMLSNSFKRLRYVRYADDFLVGFICDRCEALIIKNHIKNFLREHLHLELKNYKMILRDVAPRKHFNYTSQARFLGYLISMHSGITTRTKKCRKRLTGKGHVVLKVDQQKVIARLAEKRFCTKEGAPRPKFTYIYDTQAVTNEKINRIFRGIINYYKLADNVQHFGCRLFYIFSHSLAKMYAAKFRWHRRATIFKIGGRDLSQPLLTKKGTGYLGRANNSYIIPLKGIIYSHYKDVPKPIRAPLNPEFTATFDEIYQGKEQDVNLIQELLRKHTISGPIQIGTLTCVDCGSRENVNLHHIKALRSSESLQKKILAKSLRKVIPVCRVCHLKRHGGSFRNQV